MWAKAASLPSAYPSPMKANCKYLIVDDNKTDQIVTKLLLEKKLGASDVNTVDSGKEGIHWIQSNKKVLQTCLIILLDIKMPEMDGFAFLDAFSNLDDDIKNITQIFMLSSTLDPSDLKRADQHPLVKKLLNKPLPTQTLYELIK